MNYIITTMVITSFVATLYFLNELEKATKKGKK